MRSSALVLVAFVLTACGPRNIANENDALRARVDELESEVLAVSRERDELAIQLAAIEAAAVPTDVSPEMRQYVPTVTVVKLSSLSHVRPDRDGGATDTLLLYAEPEDGRGRFVQMAGTLSINVARLPAGTDARTIARVDLSPAELRDAYRSGFGGTHYTIEIPIPTAEANGTLDVRVHYEDARTGRTYEASRSVKVQ